MLPVSLPVQAGTTTVGTVGTQTMSLAALHQMQGLPSAHDWTSQPNATDISHFQTLTNNAGSPISQGGGGWRVEVFSPVNNIVESARLWDSRVFTIHGYLGGGLHIEMLWLHGLLASGHGHVGARREGSHLVLVSAVLLGVLVERVEDNKLVLLPVAGFGVCGALGEEGAGVLTNTGVLAAAGLGW